MSSVRLVRQWGLEVIDGSLFSALFQDSFSTPIIPRTLVRVCRLGDYEIIWPDGERGHKGKARVR